MSDKKSIFDGAEYLYAEQLKGKEFPLTITGVEKKEIVGDGGRKSVGFSIAFQETKKKLIVAGMTIRRQLAIACGTDNPDEMTGKRIILYPVTSAKSISKQAIRISIADKVNAQ